MDVWVPGSCGYGRKVNKEGRLGGERCRTAPLASIRQMSRQVSRGSAGEYQADEQAGVARRELDPTCCN